MNVTLDAGHYYVFVNGVGEGTASTGYTTTPHRVLQVLLQFV